MKGYLGKTNRLKKVVKCFWDVMKYEGVKNEREDSKEDDEGINPIGFKY
jgi:hypothetical protein